MASGGDCPAATPLHGSRKPSARWTSPAWRRSPLVPSTTGGRKGWNGAASTPDQKARLSTHPRYWPEDHALMPYITKALEAPLTVAVKGIEQTIPAGVTRQFSLS